RETTRHRDTGTRQVADHFAQRGVLATHLGQVGQAQAIQPQNQLGQGEISWKGGTGHVRTLMMMRRSVPGKEIPPDGAVPATGRDPMKRLVFYVSDGTGITAET